jgi:hypothetical protein
MDIFAESEGHRYKCSQVLSRATEPWKLRGPRKTSETADERKWTQMNTGFICVYLRLSADRCSSSLVAIRG